MTHDTLIDLSTQVREGYRQVLDRIEKRIIVCAGTGCVANGALRVHDALVAGCNEHGIDARVELAYENPSEHTHLLVSKSGCQGFCQMGPLVTILPENILYTKVTPGDAREIVQKTVADGQVIERLLYSDPVDLHACKGVTEIPFYTRQNRSVLAACGTIDPQSIHEYIATGGYSAAQKAIVSLAPEAICKTVIEAGLRGRGGGGFPTGKKWDLTRLSPGAQKYIVCNGDEGDPGAFMDRSVMEGNPHCVIEGMLVAAKAVGASKGYIYVRLEYPLAVDRMKGAVSAARKAGFLGNGIFGTDFSFDIIIMEGAGAFVCGEETAMLASIEGQRGMPQPKPPYPAQEGLFGCPTLINNVETFGNIPLIFRDGVAKYRSGGTERSPGTKTFALTGHVANTGLIEVPFGATLRQIIFDIGGGVTGADGIIDPNGFKAVQIGGPSGACLTREHLDMPLDFDSLRGVGAMVGSGGLVVMNQSTCMVGIARYFMQFAQNESCGKCVSCREGTRQMLALLNDITEGRGTPEKLSLLKTTARVVAKASLCGLGKTAPNPVISTLHHFADEYEAHITAKCCPAGECRALCRPVIESAKCIGCGLCIKSCAVGAISGARKTAHVIDPLRCINCRACVSTCKVHAIA